MPLEESTIHAINLCSTIIMAAASFIVLAFLYQRDGPLHHRAFLIFWGALFALIVLDRFLRYSWPYYLSHASLGLAVDAINNVCGFLAAYSLHRGARFVWNDRLLYALFAAMPALFFVEVLFGFFVDTETEVVWKLFYAAPSSFIASVGLVLLAITTFREPAAAVVRWPLLIIFIIYAFLQIPAYICDYAQIPAIQDDIQRGQQVIMSFLAVAKVGLVLSFATILIANGNNQSAQRFAGACKITLTILTAAFTVYVFFYRYFEFLHYATRQHK